MIRSDKEVIDRAWMDAVLRDALFCHLGLCDDTQPYVVAMNFLWDEGRIFLHCRPEGEKMRILHKNPAVTVTVETGVELIWDPDPCACSMRYRSVNCQGIANLVRDPDEKHRILCRFAGKYTRTPVNGFSQKGLDHLEVIAITVTSRTGKSSGYQDKMVNELE